MKVNAHVTNIKKIVVWVEISMYNCLTETIIFITIIIMAKI